MTPVPPPVPLDAAFAVKASRGQRSPRNSLVVIGPDGKPAALEPGTNGQFLRTDPTSGELEWAAGSAGASGGTPAVVLAAVAAPGSSTHFLRDDDTIAAFDATNPSTQASADSPAVGTAAVAARRDHKHGMPTIPGAVSGGTPAVLLGAAAAAGSAATFLRDDDTIAAFDATAPVNQAFGDSAAVGSASKAARRDHKHGMPASPERAQSTTTPSAPGVASYGSGTTDARGDHVHPLTETINFIIDGGGATITTGIKGDIVLDFGCTIVSAELRECSSVGTATAVVNIWKTAEAAWPPTVSNKITSSTPPTLSGTAKEIDSTLTSWTTAISAGDILRINVDSCTGGQRLTLSLKVTRA